jgi:hypothetical protein
MSHSRSRSTPWPNRQQRILALTKSLFDDLESVTLNEVDGEFYWRICRDDLLEPLSQLAASIAPHVLDARKRNDQFDDAQQHAIDEYRQELLRLDDETRERVLELHKMDLKAKELFSAGQPFAQQLPDFVWQHFSTRRRIPMRAPLRFDFIERGHAIEIRVFSRTLTGAQLDAFIRDDHSRPYLPREPEPRSWAVLDDLERQEHGPQSVSTVSLHIDFALVNPSAHSPLKSPARLEDPPFIHIRMSRPVPPPGVISSMYDTIVRDWHKWHLELPGEESRQELHTAIWTWAVFLLMKEQMDFYEARWAVEERTRAGPPKQPPTRNWFEKSRTKLIDRVPEAEEHLYPRQRRSNRPRSGGRRRPAITPQSQDLGL